MTGYLTRDDTIVLIPARGGSKGIPRKNLRTVGDVPLVARSVRSAISAGRNWPVFVSTDDPEIAGVARTEGARVVDRPAELSTDQASSEDAISHFLDTTGTTTGSLIMIQPTSPFLQGDDLVRLAALRDGFDSGLTVCESHAFIWRAERDATLSGVNHDPAVRKRRQDNTTEEFFENGAAYYMDVAGFLRHRHRFFGRIGFVSMPRLRSIEIDDPDDLALADLISRVIER